MSHELVNLTKAHKKRLIAYATKQMQTVVAEYVGVMRLPVDIPSLKAGNRDTFSKEILKKLKTGNGVESGLWRPPAVIRVSLENARAWLNSLSDEDREYYLHGLIDGFLYIRWDGDHRRWMYKVLHNDAFIGDEQNLWGNLEYDCLVYETHNPFNANYMFAAVQKTTSKALTPEEFFVNEVKSGNVKAQTQINLANVLDVVGMKVSAAGITAGNQTGIEVLFNDADFLDRTAEQYIAGKLTIKNKVNGAVVKWVPSAPVIKTDVIKDVVRLHSSAFGSPIASSTFLRGMLLLRIVRPGMFFGQPFTDLVKFIKRDLSYLANQTMEAAVSRYKYAGGNQHNGENESVALGLATMFGGAVEGIPHIDVILLNHGDVPTLGQDLGILK